MNPVGTPPIKEGAGQGSKAPISTATPAPGENNNRRSDRKRSRVDYSDVKRQTKKAK
jgi:hypothetical protein